MAVGFSPKHIEILPLDEVSQQHFLVLAHETAVHKGWTIGHVSNNGLIAYTNNGMFSWNTKVEIRIEDGIATVKSESTGNEMMDWGKNKKNVTRFLAELDEFKLQLSDEQVSAKFEELKPDLVPEEEDVLTLPPQSTMDQFKDFFSIFKPVEGYFVTPVLLNLNILVFLAMVVSGVNLILPSNESLLAWGANFRPMTINGQWWRLITNCFLHIGILHLLMNMYALAYIGILLEPILGRLRFASAYLLTGIVASVASLWWHSYTISAGASGAIFGMYGVFLALLTTDLIDKTARKPLLSSIGIFVGYNLLFGLKGGIDNAAHIGGLLSGIVAGYAFVPSIKNPDKGSLKIGTIALLSILLFASSFVAFNGLSDDIGTYNEKMKKFSTMESMALEVFNLPQTTSDEDILYEIKERGIYYWNENLRLVDSFSELDLPSEIVAKNKLLRQYCQLRISSYDLLYKTVAEGTEKYNTQLEAYNKQIEAKIKEIGE